MALIVGTVGLVIAVQTRAATRRQAGEMARSNALAQEANRIAKQAHDLAEERSAPRVRWQVRWNGGDTYVVENQGDGTAFQVEVAHEGLVETFSDSRTSRLAPSEAVEFMATVTMSTRDNTVYANWAPDKVSGDRQQWQHPLPPRPRT